MQTQCQHCCWFPGHSAGVVIDYLDTLSIIVYVRTSVNLVDFEEKTKMLFVLTSKSEPIGFVDDGEDDLDKF